MPIHKLIWRGQTNSVVKENMKHWTILQFHAPTGPIFSCFIYTFFTSIYESFVSSLKHEKCHYGMTVLRFFFALKLFDLFLLIFYEIIHLNNILETSKGVQVAFLAHQSWRLTRWGCSIARLPSSSTLSNKNISKTSWPNLVKFYQ